MLNFLVVRYLRSSWSMPQSSDSAPCHTLVPAAQLSLSSSRQLTLQIDSSLWEQNVFCSSLYNRQVIIGNHLILTLPPHSLHGRCQTPLDEGKWHPSLHPEGDTAWSNLGPFSKLFFRQDNEIKTRPPSPQCHVLDA